MRSIKKTSLSFGPVNINVKLFTSSDSHDVKFSMKHGPSCLGSVGYRNYCKSCEQDVAYGDIVKGVDVDDQLIIVSKDDFESLDTEQDGIQVVQFVQADEVDPILYDKSYLVDADTGGKGKKENQGPAKAYALLREAIRASGKVGVVKFALRQRSTMGVLRVYGDALVIHTLLWSDEIRSTDELVGAKKKIDLSPKELAIAESFIDAYTEPWKPDDHVDSYQERLCELISAKASGGEFVVDDDEALDNVPEVDDLIAKLEASIKAKKDA